MYKHVRYQKLDLNFYNMKSWMDESVIYLVYVLMWKQLGIIGKGTRDAQTQAVFIKQNMAKS